MSTARAGLGLAAVGMFTFSVCSSTLLLVNKVCMHRVPAASFISTVQFVATGITSHTCLTLKHTATRGCWRWREVA